MGLFNNKFSSENKQLRTKNKVCKEEMEELLLQKEDFMQKYMALLEEKSQNFDKYLYYEQQCDNYKAQIKDLKKEINDLKCEIEELINEDKKKEDTIEKLNKKIEKCQKDVENTKKHDIIKS